jgi:hypothetical protein
MRLPRQTPRRKKSSIPGNDRDKSALVPIAGGRAADGFGVGEVMNEKKPGSELAGSEQTRPVSEENVSVVRGVLEPTPLRSTAAEQKPPRPEAAMNMESNLRRSRGRLNRETMNRLGKTLEAYYDDVRKEGVPDRFKDLLQQLEGRQDKGTTG